jgi:hypothetical protein
MEYFNKLLDKYFDEWWAKEKEIDPVATGDDYYSQGASSFKDYLKEELAKRPK